MQLPARIGKYELEEFLGGGMSHVYRARDTVIGRTVALKILTEAGCEDAEAKERFLAEARMAGNISHDNVLSIYDFGEDEQHHPFMVMEFLKGEDLRHAIKNGRTGELKDKLKIAVQVARALAYIHTQKIIHRDIKPENVNLSPSGVVKLMDFGIAKTEGLQMTRAGYVLGTPYYMAPEQVTGQNVTEQVDVYAFGVLLFELMTGAKPIGGDSVERIFFSILNEPLNLEPMRKAGAPETICDLVSRCTLKKPAERPQGFGPVIADLERMLADLDAPTVYLPGATAQPVSAAGAARPAWLLPVALLLVVGLGVGLYFAFKPKNEPPRTAPRTELPASITAKSGEMVLVPAGHFKYGEDKEDASLPAYYIDKTEVTNQAYAAFCQAASHALPPDFPADKPEYPVVNVTMQDAKNFATWAGERLPVAREWEKAARGTDGRAYPWGDEKDSSRASLGPHGTLHRAADFANFAGPFKTVQMVGNVWELVDERTTPGDPMLKHFATLLTPAPTMNDPWYQIRGGSFTESIDDIVIWDKGSVPAVWKDTNIGFRCVKDAP
jgi:formylglycine-generating enzyme required for sulfatase activity